MKKYVGTSASAEAWRSILDGAGMPGKMFIAMKHYDDAELVALVQSASAATGTRAPVLLRDFGTFIVPGLLRTYKAFMRPEWRTLDVLEHTRLSPTEVRITYRSGRKLCPVAERIIQGIANHFGERMTTTHAKCMNRGDAACELGVQLAKRELP